MASGGWPPAPIWGLGPGTSEGGSGPGSGGFSEPGVPNEVGIPEGPNGPRGWQPLNGGDGGAGLGNGEPFPVEGPSLPETPTITRIELPGDWPNGATIIATGDTATVHIEGIETAEDLVQIINAAGATGATNGTISTGTIIDDGMLASCQRLADTGGTFLGGRVVQTGPNTFNIEYYQLPEIH